MVFKNYIGLLFKAKGFVIFAAGSFFIDLHKNGSVIINKMEKKIVNKVETKVQLVHKPTGIQIQCSETRSQQDNRQRAMQMLRSQLYEIELKKKQAQRADIEAGKMKIEWGSQIRNYVMQPYKLVKDVRTGYETSDVDGVLNGDIDPFLKAFLMMMGQKEEK